MFKPKRKKQRGRGAGREPDTMRNPHVAQYYVVFASGHNANYPNQPTKKFSLPDDGMTTEERYLHHKRKIDKLCMVKIRDWYGKLSWAEDSERAQSFLKDLCGLQCFEVYAKHSDDGWLVELLLIQKMSSKARSFKKAQKQAEAMLPKTVSVGTTAIGEERNDSEIDRAACETDVPRRGTLQSALRDISERDTVTHNSVQLDCRNRAADVFSTREETEPLNGDKVVLENAESLPRGDFELSQSDNVNEILTRKRKLGDLSQFELMELMQTVQNAIYEKRGDSQPARFRAFPLDKCKASIPLRVGLQN